MKAIIIFISIFFTAGAAQADTLTLAQSYAELYKNHPLSGQGNLYSQASRYKIENLNANYLPKLTLNGQATYQSDVTEFPFSTPLFQPPEQHKDQYKIFLDVKQVVYDGGLTSSQVEAEESQLKVERQRAEVELYQLKQRVNDMYFAVLLSQQNREILELSRSSIEQRLREMESKITNGQIPGNSRYPLQAELLKIEQEISDAEMRRKASVKMLSGLIDKPLGEDVLLAVPDPVVTSYDNKTGARPEERLFELQKSQVEALKNIPGTKTLPKVNLFGQGGYGRPGLNFLDNNFKEYYTVGISFTWNPVDWGTDDNERQIYAVNQSLIDKQKENFERNLKVTLDNYISEVQRLEELIRLDHGIIEARERTTESAASQVQNGTVTPTTYITELNAETQARLLLVTHRLQLAQAKINYLTAKGN
jgi:outer membrane protein TolC